MSKTLTIINAEMAKDKINDIEIIGNGDLFQLLCKASSKSQHWMKSCKAMEIPGVGCIVQVTTQQGNNVAEAVTFIPNVQIEEDVNGGKKLVGQYVNSPTTPNYEPIVSDE